MDKESGLYFFNARHYDPEIARFVTADTVIDGESSVFGWNRYMYVHGNPVMMKDPSGNEGEESAAEVIDFTSVTLNNSQGFSDQDLAAIANLQLQQIKKGTTGKVLGIAIKLTNRGPNKLKYRRMSNGYLWLNMARAAKETGVTGIWAGTIYGKRATHKGGYAVDLNGLKFEGDTKYTKYAIWNKDDGWYENPSKDKFIAFENAFMGQKRSDVVWSPFQMYAKRKLKSYSPKSFKGYHQKSWLSKSKLKNNIPSQNWLMKYPALQGTMGLFKHTMSKRVRRVIEEQIRIKKAKGQFKGMTPKQGYWSIQHRHHGHFMAR